MPSDSFPENSFIERTLGIIEASNGEDDDQAVQMMEELFTDFATAEALPTTAHPALYALVNCAKKTGLFIHYFDFFQRAAFRPDWDVEVRSKINALLPVITANPTSEQSAAQLDDLLRQCVATNVIYPMSEDVMEAMIAMAVELKRPDHIHTIDRARFYSKCLDPDHSPHKRPGGYFEIVGNDIPGFNGGEKATSQGMYEDLVTSYPHMDANRWYIEVLVDYAKECETITELGVFQGVATSGFLSTGPKRYRGYDLDFSRFDTKLYLDVAEAEGIDAEFIHGSTHEIEIEPVDFLFIDTVHTYEHVREEVRKHHRNANKFIAIHDTNYPKPPRPGVKVRVAAEDLVSALPEWTVVEDIKKYTGMIILKRN